MAGKEEAKPVDEAKSAPEAPGDCCFGTSDQKPSRADGSLARCNCGPAPGPISWPKALVAGLILLAAIGIGAYSRVVARGAETADSATPPTFSAASAAAQSSVGDAPLSGFCRPANAVVQPTSCGGDGTPPPAASGHAPTCGAARSGGCGQ